MPYVTESRYAELLQLELAVDRIKPHVDSWIGMLEAYVESLPAQAAGMPGADRLDGEGSRAHGETMLRAMRIGLGALYPAHALSHKSHI